MGRVGPYPHCAVTDPAADRDLESKLRRLVDRMEILECLNRCARGMDRHDAALIASAYHPEAIDDHGLFQGGVTEFIRHVNGDGDNEAGAHGRLFHNHLHYLTNTSLEIAGDTAYGESYYLFSGNLKTGTGVLLTFGRYIDRLERRADEWRIAHRRVILEYSGVLDTSGAVSAETAALFVRGRWDRSDPSYERCHDGHEET